MSFDQIFSHTIHVYSSICMKFLLYVFPYLHIDYVKVRIKKRRLSCWIWCTVRIFTHAVWFMYQSSLHEENFDSLVLHLDDT